MNSFVIMPFRNDLDSTFEVIKEVCQKFNIDVNRGDTIFKDGLIINQIYEEIEKSDIVFADVSLSNPNVLYEIGYAHAMNKRTILMVKKEMHTKFPFDISGFRCIIYEEDSDLKFQLEKYLIFFKSIDLNSPEAIIQDSSFFKPESSSNTKSYMDLLKENILNEYGVDDFKLISKTREKNHTIFTFQNSFEETIIIKVDLNGTITRSKKIN